MRTRPYLFMVLTLLIGFVVGFLVSGQIRHSRMKPVRIYFSERQMKEGLSRMLEPTEDQIKKLEPVLRAYGKKNRELQKKFRTDFDEMMKNYWEEVKPVLTPEQIEKIESMEKRRKDAVRRFRPDTSNNRSGRDGWHGRSRMSPPDSTLHQREYNQ